jgi:hypothetical protein
MAVGNNSGGSSGMPIGSFVSAKLSDVTICSGATPCLTTPTNQYTFYRQITVPVLAKAAFADLSVTMRVVNRQPQIVQNVFVGSCHFEESVMDIVHTLSGWKFKIKFD